MNIKYYCVGFNWGGQETNQLARFKKEGIWENGYADKFHHTINSIPTGSRIAAKTAYTRKENGKNISVLHIYALGTVTENPQNGIFLKVDWDKNFIPFRLDGKGAYRSTISTIHNRETIRLIFEHNASVADLTETISVNPNDKKYDHPLNQILYGPPGTGKTYQTINKAVAILDSYKSEKLSRYFATRQELKDRFDDLLIKDWDNPQGQIAFITFHQSTSYEDFVEGIKPLPPKTENGQVIYKVEDGIFKRIAKLAGQTQLRLINIDDQSVELTEELFETLYYDFAETLNSADMDVSNCELTTIEGYRFGLFKNSAGSICIKSGKLKTKMSASFIELKKVHFEKKSPIYKSYEQKIIDKILENKNYKETENENTVQPFVLIIDEINRGNVSQIFGELITLIEEDKRKNKPEALEAILPYSKEKLTIPQNLHIIGTMNTADRSVEALDTALRRRFTFEEIPPMPLLLTPERMVWDFWWDNEEFPWDDAAYMEREKTFYQLLGFPEDKNNDKDKEVYWVPMRKDNIQEEPQIELLKDLSGKFTGINLCLLLTYINKRIEKLLSKDHMIGHAYLINVRSVADLKNAFFNKIHPLLQEYFYGDYGRIGLVIGDVFLHRESKSDVKLMKVPGYDTGDLNEGSIYRLKKAEEFATDEAFINALKAIYA